jgi:hypothetical protein
LKLWNTKPIASRRSKRGLGFADAAHRAATQHNIAGIGLVDQAGEVEQRALAAARRTGQREHFTRPHDQVHPLQCTNHMLAQMVGFVQATQLENWLRFRELESSQRRVHGLISLGLGLVAQRLHGATKAGRCALQQRVLQHLVEQPHAACVAVQRRGSARRWSRRRSVSRGSSAHPGAAACRARVQQRQRLVELAQALVGKAHWRIACNVVVARIVVAAPL